MGSARIASLAAVAALSVSAFAMAGNPPLVSIDVTVDGNNTPFAPGGTNTATTGVYNYIGSGIGAGHITTWNFNATNSAETSPAFVSGNFTFTNTSALIQVYDVLVTLFTSPAGPSSLIGGSVAGGLTANEDGGVLSTLPQTPLWTAYIDGNAQASLIPFGVAAAGPFDSATLGSDAFGIPIPSQPGPALGSTMQIRLQFALTPGDQASFTSVFVLQVVPAPAGLALLGLAGLTGRRRRD